MTPEQREAHAETLRNLATCFSDGTPTSAACIAGAAALAPPPTCGTCKHGENIQFAHDGWIWCSYHSSMRKVDDGCIKGYASTGDAR